MGIGRQYQAWLSLLGHIKFSDLGEQTVDIPLPICAGLDENNKPSFSCILKETLTHFVTSRRVLLWDTLAVIHYAVLFFLCYEQDNLPCIGSY